MQHQIVTTEVRPSRAQIQSAALELLSRHSARLLWSGLCDISVGGLSVTEVLLEGRRRGPAEVMSFCHHAPAQYAPLTNSLSASLIMYDVDADGGSVRARAPFVAEVDSARDSYCISAPPLQGTREFRMHMEVVGKREQALVE